MTADLTATVLRLRAAGCVFAEEEAAVLAETAGHDGETLSALVERRATGEPLEQVVGHADFCGVRVRLRPGVFVPRVRSELLVRLATEEIQAGRGELPAHLATKEIQAVRGELPARLATKEAHAVRGELPIRPPTRQTPAGGPEQGPLVVDLCCGSGALGLAVRHRSPGITLHAADLDPVAVACARDNLGDHVHQGDLFAALPGTLRGRIDVLLANVPYVATRHLAFLPAEARDHEPRTALDGGDDGLTVFRAVVAGARDWLAPGGLLLSEITAAQVETALAIASGDGLTATLVEDDDLDAHAMVARLSPGRNVR